ncbi:MAG: hypothetical protein MUO76_07805 [Anaerolineaceae bacterium]|nr:hypothetical protein [Anaerolineaceae bacterium]
MNKMIPKNDAKKELMTGWQSVLEKEYIKEYLKTKGYQLVDLKGLPENEAKQLMKEACRHASLKLAEMESRSHFITGITKLS